MPLHAECDALDLQSNMATSNKNLPPEQLRIVEQKMFELFQILSLVPGSVIALLGAKSRQEGLAAAEALQREIAALAGSSPVLLRIGSRCIELDASGTLASCLRAPHATQPYVGMKHARLTNAGYVNMQA